MNSEQFEYLAWHYQQENTNRGKVLAIFPELIPYLFDFYKPMKLIDLSWMKCTYGTPYIYSEDNTMWGKMFDVLLVNGRATFKWGNRLFETQLIFFKPNNI